MEEKGKEKEKGFHKKGFISLLSLGSFLVMTFNGLVLYVAPQGRIAYWVIWRFLGITREDWINMHLISSILFVVAGIIHLIYNWKPFLSYLSRKISGGLKLKKELILAGLLSFYVIVGPVVQIPPLNWIIGFGEYLKETWIVSRDYEPPFGHAEAVSLKSFAKKTNIDFEKAMQELKQQGIKVEGGEATLEKIAKDNQTTPMKLYVMIKKFEQVPETPKGQAYTPEMVDEKFSGMGIGRKTLAEMCKEAGIEMNKARENLKKNNIEMKDDETLKDAATKRNVNPVDVLKSMLVDQYKLP